MPAPWTQVTDPEALASWDRDLMSLDDWTLDQSYAWGEHSRHLGWQVRRFAASEGGRVRAMAQVLGREPVPGVGMLWSPGGPVGDIGAWDDTLRRAVRRAFPALGHYYRVFSHRPLLPADAALLRRAGWQPAQTKLRSGMSMRLSLAAEPDELMRGLSSNWRHNLRRAGKRGLVVRRWERPAISEIRAIYRSMEAHKDLREQFSESQLTSLYDCFGDRLVTWRCDDADGRLLAVRACVTLGDQAWDMLAAASADARKVYASYLLFWELLLDGRRRGVRRYELRGVEPDKTPGVYEFKKGTGAELVEYLGEWDWASISRLRVPANWAVARQRAGD